MAWGSNTLSDKDFYKLMARFADVTNLQTVEKYWTAAAEVIIREMYINHSCRVPLLGTFYAEEIPESIQKQKDENGNDIYYHIPKRIKAKFEAHDDFINDINMVAVTKLGRRRARRGEETERDKIRRMRADSLSAIGPMTEEKMEQTRTQFRELLENKKRKAKGKVDLTENED